MQKAAKGWAQLAAQQWLEEVGWTWLAVVGMINSAISLYYYLRVTVAMYFESPSEETAERRDTGLLRFSVVVAAIFTILIGIYPSLWVDIFQAGLGS